MQSACYTVNSHQQCMWIPAIPHAHQYLLSSVFFNVAIFVGVRCKEQSIRCKTHLLIINIGYLTVSKFCLFSTLILRRFTGFFASLRLPLVKLCIRILGLSLCSKNWQVPWGKCQFSILWVCVLVCGFKQHESFYYLSVSVGKNLESSQLRGFQEVSDRQWCGAGRVEIGMAGYWLVM